MKADEDGFLNYQKSERKIFYFKNFLYIFFNFKFGLLVGRHECGLGSAIWNRAEGCRSSDRRRPHAGPDPRQSVANEPWPQRPFHYLRGHMLAKLNNRTYTGSSFINSLFIFHCASAHATEGENRQHKRLENFTLIMK